MLALLRLPLGRDMDGAVMEALLPPRYFDGAPLAWVDTHTSADCYASRDRAIPKQAGDEERLEQLRALGYLGD